MFMHLRFPCLTEGGFDAVYACMASSTACLVHMYNQATCTWFIRFYKLNGSPVILHDEATKRERERETEIPLGIHLHKHTCDVLILSANQVNFINRQTYSRCLRFVTTFILRTKNNNMMRWDQYRRKKILRNEKLCWVEYKMATVKPALTSLVRSLSFFFCRHNF